MPKKNFIQFDVLRTYSGVCLNRDENGFAKTQQYGPATRLRISSQCIKHNFRGFNGADGLADLALPRSFQSRRSFLDLLITPWIAEGMDPARAESIAQQAMLLVAGKPDKDKPTETSQVVLLGEEELRFLKDRPDLIERTIAKADAGQKKENKKEKGKGKEKKEDSPVAALKEEFEKYSATTLTSGWQAALFGRMTTQDFLSRMDAAVNVSHAITTHAAQTDVDYFSAVDDLAPDTGAGHIGDTQLTSGTFYSYSVVEMPTLTRNLGVYEGKALEICKRWARMMAKAPIGAKRGSTGSFAYADLLMLRIGDEQPVSNSGAFYAPVPMAGNIAEESAKRLLAHQARRNAVFGEEACAFVSPLALPEEFGDKQQPTLNGLLAWLEEHLGS